MSDFEDAVIITIDNEGGYVVNAADSGGPTKYGITQADMPGVDIFTLTVGQAAAYYKQYFWNPLYAQIISQAVCNKIFDMGVLCGKKTAVKILESVLRTAIDGIFGPNDLTVLNLSGEAILPVFKGRMISHFQAIVEVSPKDVVFLEGWINRANS